MRSLWIFLRRRGGVENGVGGWDNEKCCLKRIYCVLLCMFLSATPFETVIKAALAFCKFAT